MKLLKFARLLLSVAVLLAFSSCDTAVEAPATINEAYLHGRAAWSPDGRTIAFSSLVENQVGIYVTDTAGVNIRQIVQGEGVGATWSPDGSWIVFSRAGSLFKVKPDGDSLKQLTEAVGAIRPSWSKDGSKIAYVVHDATGGSVIWLYDVAKATTTSLISKGDFPCWHPTTGEVVILDGQYDSYSGYVAYAFLGITVSTTVARVIGSFSTAADCGFIAIKPSGSDILFGLVSPTDYAQIWSYNISANRHTKITDDGGDYPAWSPDGSRIVYTRTQQGDGGLWTMNADGSGKRRLTKAQ